jgi:hypothetical protein
MQSEKRAKRVGVRKLYLWGIINIMDIFFKQQPIR